MSKAAVDALTRVAALELPRTIKGEVILVSWKKITKLIKQEFKK